MQTSTIVTEALDAIAESRPAEGVSDWPCPLRGSWLRQVWIEALALMEPCCLACLARRLGRGAHVPGLMLTDVLWEADARFGGPHP